jgi:Ca2+-transporting ATPase
LWWITGGAIGFLALVLTVPFLRDLFKFAPLHAWELALIAGACLVSILVAESVKVKALRRIITGGQ